MFIRTSDLFIDNHNLVDGRVFKGSFSEFLGKGALACTRIAREYRQRHNSWEESTKTLGRATPVIL
jgi:hypothetical protein